MLAMSAIDTAKEIVRITSTAGLSKDVIDLLEKKVSLLTEQVTTLEREKTDLKKKIADLEQREASTKAEEFVEEFGAAFRRKADGSFHQAIYCPIHHTTAGSPDGAFPYSCSDPNCNWSSDITPNTLRATIRKLNPNSLGRILDL